jgi:1-acyl-sn-glycerol-3-phosphate acyltransferase
LPARRARGDVDDPGTGEESTAVGTSRPDRFAVVVRTGLNRLVTAIALPLTLIVVTLVCLISAERGARVARGGVMWIARMCGVRFVDDGCEVLRGDGSFVVVANHSSPLDIAAMLFVGPEVRFLASAELFRVPLLSAAMRGMRTIPIERRDRQAARRQLDGLVDTVASMSEFRIVIFPEGGIPAAGARLPFKAGAFELAIRTGAPILPVAIHGSADVLPPKGRLGVRPGRVCIQALRPISTDGLTLEDLSGLRGEAEEAILAALGAAPPPSA